MMIKLDLEKAYNRMEWGFLRDTLYDAGLPDNLLHIIMDCIKGGSYKLLWNGEVTDQIFPTRGLRQGDPLSSYLFLLCLEHLAH